jgi:alkanesulfonate monooxygenase SsuD/methylene tetrahydromethanopterin reductase-like flavin-dependent oxidoreductase (luciferase family)
MATVCIWALAADTDSEARRLAMTRESWRIGFEKGLRTSLVTPEEAAAQPYSDADLARIAQMRERAFVGTADRVGDRLRAEAARLALDELVIVTWTHDPAARERSYALLADAFCLEGSRAPSM